VIWLVTGSLAAGGLLAQRFNIIVLAPATFVVVIVAVALGVAQSRASWSTILIMATVSVAVQVGYFLGMLIQYGLTVLLARRHGLYARRAQNHSISRTPIS